MGALAHAESFVVAQSEDGPIAGVERVEARFDPLAHVVGPALTRRVRGIVADEQRRRATPPRSKIPDLRPRHLEGERPHVAKIDALPVALEDLQHGFGGDLLRELRILHDLQKEASDRASDLLDEVIGVLGRTDRLVQLKLLPTG